MYPRWLYVGLLGVSVGALALASALGGGTESLLAYAVVVLLGGVVFFQGEARVTPRPLFASVTAALVVGSVVALLAVTGLLVGLIGAPWDLALWRGGLMIWSDLLGIAFAFTGSFFVVGAVGSFL